MHTNWTDVVNGYSQGNHRRKVWQRIVSTLICIVVFCTTYALILPAITMEGNAICGMVEHVHTDDCYLLENDGNSCTAVHTHTQECYDESANLICGKADYALHTHDTNCYDENGTLICALEELTDQQEHIHTDECYTEGVLTCGLLELTSHQHTQECWQEREASDEPLCGLEEHIHSEDCYENLLTQLFAVTLASDDDSTATSDSSLNYQISLKSDVVYDPATDTYAVTLRSDFALTVQQIKDANYTFTIDLPSDVIVPDDLLNTWYVAVDEHTDNMVAFDYQIVPVTGADGKVTYRIEMKFREDYVTTLEGKSSDAKVYVQFNGAFSSSALDSNGNLVIKDGDTELVNIPADDIVYPDDVTHNYDISTTKTGSYVSADNKLTYTVTVSTSKGTPSPITVTDVLKENGISVTDLSSVVVKDQNGTTVDGYSANASESDGTWTLTVTGLDGLDPGESYTITYTYDLEDVAAGTTSWPNNTVTA